MTARTAMTEDEIISALKAAGFEYELSTKKSDLKYPMTLNIYQATFGHFSGTLIGTNGLVFSVQNVDAPDGVVKAVVAAGYSLCYVIRVHPSVEGKRRAAL